MRIVDEWDNQGIKFTAFIMNGKYSLKAETNLLEQTFKFRDGQISTIDHLKGLLTDDFYKTCKTHFLQMDLTRSKLFSFKDEEMSFPEII